MKWEKVSLESISTRIGDGLHGTPKYDDNGEFYFINGNNLSEGKILIKEDTKRISSIEYDKIKKELSEKTVLVAINGTLGNVGLYRDEPVALGKSACYINVNDKAEKLFVRYVLENHDFQRYAIDFATGSTIKNLGLKAVRDYSFNLPPLPTQRKIASILSAYDDLIENNLKRIKLLEEKALMEYRMLFSENELNEFPLEDVWDIKYGKNLPQTKITEIGKYPVYGAAGRIGFYEEFNYEFPVALVTSRGNGSGVAHRTNQAAFVTNNSFAFVPKEKFVNVHFHLAEMILRDLELTQLRSGTAQPQLTIAGLIGVKLKLPNKESLVEFNKTVDPVFDLIHTLEKQNTKLREARDILLPKLMNGQIEV